MTRYIVVALVVAGLFCQTAWAQQSARPNIVLIIADDLGYGDLSSYGAPDIKRQTLIVSHVMASV